MAPPQVYALIFTAVIAGTCSCGCPIRRPLAAVTFIARPPGSSSAGVCGAGIPDNMKPVIAAADAVNPQLTVGWLDYAAAPRRVRHRPCPGAFTEGQTPR